MTEFIPSPKEKRDGVIRNHVLDLLANLNARIRQLEHAAGIPTDLADEFTNTMELIARGESHVRRLNEALIEAGVSHGEEIGG